MASASERVERIAYLQAEIGWVEHELYAAQAAVQFFTDKKSRLETMLRSCRQPYGSFLREHVEETENRWKGIPE